MERQEFGAITNRVSITRGPVVFLVSHSAAGGAQELWANLAEGFAQRGRDVRLTALYPLRDVVREPAPGMEWTYLASHRPRTLAGKIDLFLALLKFFRDVRPCAVFTALPAANVLGPLAASTPGSRIRVVTSHHSPVSTYNPLLNFADGLVGCLGAVKAVVGVSKAVSRSQDNRPWLYRRKRLTIHNALPPRIEASIEELATARRSWPRGRTLVATGRLAEQKNYPVLIRAMAELPDVVLRIVGAGPDEESLRKLANEMGVEGRVEFLGFRPRVETLKILAAGDVFVQPSRFEGHSLALVEAARLGLPLIVSDVPVQIEGITDQDGRLCGIAVDPDDPILLAQEIRRILDNPDVYAALEAKALHLAEGSDFDTMVSAYERLALTDA